MHGADHSLCSISEARCVCMLCGSCVGAVQASGCGQSHADGAHAGGCLWAGHPVGPLHQQVRQPHPCRPARSLLSGLGSWTTQPGFPRSDQHALHSQAFLSACVTWWWWQQWWWWWWWCCLSGESSAHTRCTHKTALRSRCSKLWLQGGSQRASESPAAASGLGAPGASIRQDSTGRIHACGHPVTCLPDGSGAAPRPSATIPYLPGILLLPNRGLTDQACPCVTRACYHRQPTPARSDTALALGATIRDLSDTLLLPDRGFSTRLNTAACGISCCHLTLSEAPNACPHSGGV